MLDLKNWFNPKHYKRLWNVGPPGLNNVAFINLFNASVRSRV